MRQSTAEEQRKLEQKTRSYIIKIQKEILEGIPESRKKQIKDSSAISVQKYKDRLDACDG